MFNPLPFGYLISAAQIRTSACSHTLYNVHVIWRHPEAQQQPSRQCSHVPAEGKHSYCFIEKRSEGLERAAGVESLQAPQLHQSSTILPVAAL